MDEQWKVIPDYPDYEVSDEGRVRSWKGKGGVLPRIMSQHTTAFGYRAVKLCNLPFWRTEKVHRLVLEAFVGPCPEGMECRHGDDDRTNNRLGNLSWGTHLENCADAMARGRLNTGTRNHNAKLTDDIVREIRAKYATGNYSKSRLAREYPVSRHTVWTVVTRKTWTHVKDESESPPP